METAGSRSRERRRLTTKWRQLAAEVEKEGGWQQNGDSWQQWQRKKAADNKMETAGSRSKRRRPLTAGN
jgi:hypothetical protein